MSLAVTLSTALTSLQTSQSLLQLVANNVSNANTEGYTRKIAELRSITLEDGSGAGVELSNIIRNVDQYLLAETRSTQSALGLLEGQVGFYNRIQDLFGTPASNLSISARLSDLGTSFQELAATPESTTLQIDTVGLAVNAALQLNEMSAEIQALRAEADREISTHVSVINAQLSAIVELNGDIARNLALGYPVADLQDLRDIALRKVSELITVDTFTRATGEVVVYLPDGTILADTLAASLSHSASSSLSASVSYPSGIDGIDINSTDITANITGGRIKGLIEMRDTILPNLQAELDRLAQSLRDQVNQLHNTGAGYPPANTLTGTRSFAAPATDTISFTTNVRIGVVDGNGDFAAFYDLPAGSYTIAAIETAIDTNLAGFATATTSAGGPLSITATNAAYGIAIVDLGSNTVTHTDSVTTYTGFSYYFGLNDLFVTPGNSPGDANTGISGIFDVRGNIITTQSLISRGPLDSGTGASIPAVGDPAITPGNSSVAQALADKFTQQLSFAAAGGLSLTTTTLAGYAVEIVAANSIDAARAKSNLDYRKTLHEQLTYRLQSDSGVNIDEEMAHLVVYQNAYAAAARLIATTDELFEILTGLL